MPAHKKHPSTRARRNRTAGAATLVRPLSLVPDTDVYEGMTVAKLRVEIDTRNEDRAPDRRMPKRGTKAELVGMLALDDIAPENDVPAIPENMRTWHDLTRKWWTDVWTSPLPGQWDTATDFWNVLMIADLLNDWLTGTSANERRQAMGELRLQRSDLGLSPRARLSLEWIFENADEAKARGNERRQRTAEGAAASKGKAGGKKKRPDPRALSLA